MENVTIKEHTKRFKELRKLAEDRRKQTREKVVNRFDLISFSAETGKSSQNSSSLGWFKKSQTTLSHIVEVAPSEVNAAKFCKQCKKVFGFFATKKVCGLCGRITCPECSVRQPLRAPAPGELDACRRCASIIRFSAFKSQWKQKLAEVKSEGIAVWYDTIMALKMAISRSFPNFKGLVFSLNSVLGPELSNEESLGMKSAAPTSAPLSIPGETLYELQETAMKELDVLKRNFDQMEKRIERVKALPEGSRSEVLLKNSLKQVLGTFLQSHLPEFRFLSKQFLSTINNPRVKETIADWQKKKKLQEEEERRREAELRDREKFYELQNKSLERDGVSSKPLNASGPPPVSASSSSSVISPLPESPVKPIRPRAPSHSRSESLTDKIFNFFTEDSSSSSSSSSFFGSSPASSSSDIPISISLVHPALCPIDGGVDLSIRGTGFKQGIRVKIGNVDLSTSCITFVDSSELKVIAPAVAAPGTYSLHLKNPTGATAELDDILFYTDDPAIISSFAGAKKPSPAASPASFSAASSSSSSPISLSPASSGTSTPRGAYSISQTSAPPAPAGGFSWLDRENMSIEDVMASANTHVTLASAKLKLQQSTRPAAADDDDSHAAVAEFQRMAPPSISFVQDQPDSFRSNAFGSAPLSRNSSRPLASAPNPAPTTSTPVVAPSRTTVSSLPESSSSLEKPKTTHVIPNQGTSSSASGKPVSTGRTWGK